jgi:hypothetical protein
VSRFVMAAVPGLGEQIPEWPDFRAPVHCTRLSLRRTMPTPGTVVYLPAMSGHGRAPCAMAQ